MAELRVDQAVIADLVTEGARILDLGCGDGLLLEYLFRHKRVKGFGVEISEEGIRSCISRGLPVYHGDIDQGLEDHRDGAFDFVILSHTLQTIHHPRFVLQEMLRVGRKGIVSFPNFGHWEIRLSLLLHGRMPKSPVLPYDWHDTPNIHMCTIRDFEELCRESGIQIVRQIPLNSAGNVPQGAIKRSLAKHLLPLAGANLMAPMAVFLLERPPS
ncbi:MAG: methionine biosynthesis protein MetW [Magnetococcales bacterium]|nr:methionine biosynthesis protein MetW [Magnetococcales bacterium]